LWMSADRVLLAANDVLNRKFTPLVDVWITLYRVQLAPLILSMTQLTAIDTNG
jgi:hypothetical protein